MTSFATPMPQPYQGGGWGSPGGHGQVWAGGGLQQSPQVTLTANTGQFQSQMGLAGKSVETVTAAVGTLFSKIDDLFKAGGHDLKIIGEGTLAGLSGAVADAAALQNQMRPLAASAALTNTSLDSLGRTVDQTFTKFPVAREQVVGLVRDLQMMAVANRDISALASTLTKLQAVTGSLSIAGQMVQFSRMNGGATPSMVGRYSNSLVTTAARGGTNPSDVLNFATSISPQARAAGIGATAQLGIATAFSRSGQDGFIGANLFNSIVTDLTNLRRTHNPDITKYSQLTGMRSGSFSRLPAQQQIARVFQAIAGNSPQALNFVNSQGYGSRAITALQGVAQSGGIGPWVNLAQRSSGNTKNLDSAASAAFSGFGNSLTSARNEITQFGDLLGGPLLGVLSSVVNVFTSLMHGVNEVVRALGPIPAILAAVTSVVAPLAGGMLGHAGILGAVVGARLLTKSGPAQAMRDGRVMGQAMAGGMSREEAMGLTETGRLAATGYAPWRMTRAMEYSMKREAGAAYHGPAYYNYTPRHAAAGAAGAAAAEEEAAAAGGFGGSFRTAAGRAVPGLFTWSYRGQARMADDSTKSSYQRSAYAQARAAAAGEEVPLTGFAKYKADNAAMAGQGFFRSFAKETRTAVGQVGAAMGNTVKAGFSALGAGGTWAGGKLIVGGLDRGSQAVASGLSRLSPTLGAASRSADLALARALRSAGQGASGLLGAGMSGLGRMGSSLVSSPMGMMALIAAPMIYGSLKDKLSASYSGGGVNDATNGLNPLAKYNDALGIATQHLASFTGALDSGAAAAGKPGTTSTATTFAQAKNITSPEVAQYAGKNSSDATITDISVHSKNNVAVGRALLNSYGITDPRQLDMFGQNLLGAGWSPSAVHQVLQGYRRKGGMFSPTDFGQAINATEGQVTNTGGSILSHIAIPGIPLVGAPNGAGASGARIFATAATFLQNRQAADLDRRSPAYANARYLKGFLQVMSGQGAGVHARALDTTPTEQAFVKNIATFGGASTTAVQSALEHFDPNNADISTLSNQQRQALVLAILHRAAHPFMTNLRFGARGLGIASGSPQALDAYLAQQAVTPSASTQQLRRQFGSLGAFATGAQVNAAIGGQSGQAGYVDTATANMAEAAMKGKDGINGAAAALQRLADVAGGARGAFAQAASQWARTVAGFRQPYMSRVQNLQFLTGQQRRDYAAAHVKGASPAAVSQYHDDVQATQAAAANYNSYLLATQQQVIAYSTQRKRMAQDEQTQETRQTADFHRQQLYAEQDYDTQVTRTKADFYRSQLRAEQAYQLQVFRTERDYNISRQRAQVDFQIQQRRSTVDFNISMQRQLLQSEQTAYDPFARLQSQDTMSGGELAQNLADQNRALITQHAQLKRLRGAGLTQHAIDVLGLDDPAKAQQVAQLAGQLLTNPALVKQIDKEVSKRGEAVQKLTQSNFSATFRQQVADFTRSMSRTSSDFTRAQDRAASDEKRTLADMAQNFSIAQTQAVQDEARTLDRMDQDYQRATQRAQTAEQITLDQMGTDYKRMVHRSVVDLSQAMKELYGNLVDTFPQTLKLIGNQLEQYAPALAQKLARIVSAAQQAINGAVGTNPYGAPGVGAPARGGGGIVAGAGVGRALRVAESYLGDPYKFGGLSHSGIDCSGLVEMAYASAGINLDHSAQSQSEQGQLVTGGMKNWLPGDLLFYGRNAQSIEHVAMYVGNGMLIEAPEPGKTVHEIPVSADGSGAPLIVRRLIPAQTRTGGSAPAGSGGTNPSQRGSAANPITRPGVTGVVGSGKWAGHLGSYGKGGKFHDKGVPSASSVGRYRVIDSPKMNANTPQGAMRYARSVFASYGWPMSQFDDDLVPLWNKESSWDYTALNNDSGAVGIAQLLPLHYKGHNNPAGHPIPPGYLGSGRTQIDWGLNYIRDRWGSPQKAWGGYAARGDWYAKGSIFTGPKRIGVGEAGPEAVIPLNVRGEKFMAQSMAAAIKQMRTNMAMPMACRGEPTMVSYSYDQRTQFTGPVTVQASDPMEMARKLAARQRFDRINHPQYAGV